jgi:histidinol-phosphate aminotransferase
MKLSRRDWLRAGALGTGALLLDLPARARALPHTLLEDWGTPPSKLPDDKAPLRLMSNENPYGPSDKARQAVLDNLHRGNRYPYDYAETLKKQLADIEGVQPDNILLGAGSTELLCLAAAAYGLPGKKVVSSDLTFLALINYATKMGAASITVPVDAQYRHDLPALEKAVDADTRIVYLDNPGNPTGTLLPTDALKAFCERVSTKCLVFVDEAYRELVMDPTLALAKQRTLKDLAVANKNVVVARTFSKVYGLAGLRVGYAVAHADTIKQLAKHQMIPGLTVSAAGVAAALACLQDDAFVDYTRRNNAAVKDYTLGVLRQHGFAAAESHANFVFFDLKGRDAEQYRQYMEKQGILLRASAQPYMGQKRPHCRLSLGTMAEMKTWAEAFTNYLRS